MPTIKVRFLRLSEASPSALTGPAGLQVIWDAHAADRPTYIGEGSDRLTRSQDGYVGLIESGGQGAQRQASKAVQRLLLEVADDTDQRPAGNKDLGSMASVLAFCKRGTLCVAVSGYDPLSPPRDARSLGRPKSIKARADGHDSYEFSHDWRLRKLRKPIR